ncbi:acyl-CoA dehydrogenase [Streptomyces vietnamensis]|uniref:acyl-CoA dehydrogenase n=1 Tax=Streptomyces vietnamensis TaxID=362257 RepID=UPI000695A64B|nr:acyl-CoA dehydrogenase [Streptomyces vietnamensis]
MVTALAARGTHARATELEYALGDPADPANPVGYASLLAADRAAERFTAGEELLDDERVFAEFVPTGLGGRLDSFEELVAVMRPVFRRDVGLAMGYGMMSWMAASDVWTTGTGEQRRRLAGILLSGGKAAIAQHETAHSNQYVRSQVTAGTVGDRLLLNGAKPLINNLERARALVLFCRTDADAGSRSHSALLLDPQALPADRATLLPRHVSVGLRGCRFAGLDFRDCPVPASALLGPLGSGVTTALRSFQISRTVIAALAVGAVDTVLRTAVGFERSERSHPRHVSDPDTDRASAATTGAFVDLLLYDSLATVATRALHLLPEQTSVYSAALKYLLPKVLTETMYTLSTVLGSGIYHREGTLGIFQKHIRDVPVLSLGHAGSAACQATILPQLPRLARSSWFLEEAPPAALFRTGEPLPPAAAERLDIASGRDALSACLPLIASDITGDGPGERALAAIAAVLVDEFRDLRDRVRALERAQPHDLFPVAGFALVDRYALLLAASAVLGVWRHAGDGGDPFLADASWAAAALHVVARRLGARPPDLPPECARRVRQEMLLRFGAQLGFDLYNTPVCG